MTAAQKQKYDSIIAYVKGIYPEAVVDTYYPFANELLFYSHPKAEKPYCCHINRLNGSYIISTDF